MTSPAGPQTQGTTAHSYAENIGAAVLGSKLSAVLVLDSDWRMVECNGAAVEMFGRSRTDVLGASLERLIVSPLLRAADPGGLQHADRDADSPLVQGRTAQTGVRADGTHFPIELSLVRVGTQEQPMLVAFIRDITQRRVAEYRLAKSEALLAEAEELACSGSFERELRTGNVAWSDGIYRVFARPLGSPPPTLDGGFEMIHPDDRERARASLARTLSEHRPRFRETFRIVHPDGSERVVEIQGKVAFDDFGEPDRLIGTARDVTDEAEAQHARNLLSYVVSSSDDAILTKSPDGLITSWNRGAELLYGYTATEAIGRHISLLAAPGETEDQAELTDRVFTGEAVQHLETTRVRKDGTEVAVSLTVSPVRGRTGKIISAAVIARDVTERRRNEERLQYLAEHDHLTGLLNRRRFEEELSRELSRAARSGSGGAVLSVDLDGFKLINDSAGHAAGDAVLREAAQALSATLRDSDIIARLGGDEFAVLLPNAAQEAAEAVARHLLAALHETTAIIDGAPFRVTGSLGVAMFPPGATRSDELIVDADLAMYAAKQAGRNRIVVFTPEQAQAARMDAKLSWGQRIRMALEEDGLELHWQVIVDVGTGEPSHGELLLRMRSGGTLLPPMDFLGAAERLGLIHSIDRWVVSSAIRLLAEGRGPAGQPLSVNLSGESVVGDPDLLSLIETGLAESGVDPWNLIFEITETTAITNIVEARNFAIGVRRLGCRVALDDFGTGFGSFYHLKHLPVDFIKIDREFVHNLPHSQVDQRLIRAIVDISQAMNIQTIAESVGDDPTIAVLRELGVDFIQGFHVGRPTPVLLAPD